MKAPTRSLAHSIVGLVCLALILAVALIYSSNLRGSNRSVLESQLESRNIAIRRSVAKYIDLWAGVGNADLMSVPDEILAAKDANIPMCFPDYVNDLSGRLHSEFAPSQLRAIQRPGFKVAHNTQKLACTCKQCDPEPPVFPPVCTNCTCQEALAHPEVSFLGHAKPCPETGCDVKDKAKNAMHKWPECKQWACYNKDGWFCACTCPGESCPQPQGWL